MILATQGCYRRPGVGGPTATSATGRDACGQTGLTQREPLVIDMQPEKRADLEVALREGRGLVAVRHSCNELVVLRDCRVRGSYTPRAMTPKNQRTVLHTADEVKAALPIAGARVAIDAGLEQGADLELSLTMASTLESRDASLDEGALAGSCAGATHVVQAATFGAFSMARMTRNNASGGVSALGASASARSTDERQMLSSEGQASSCDGAAPLARGCDAVLRLTLVEVEAKLPPVDVRSFRSMFDGKFCARGVDACREGCARREARACYELGAVQGGGVGVAFAPIEAARSLKMACDLGEAGGCTLLALGYLTDGSPTISVELGRKAGARGCEMGEASSCIVMALSHRGDAELSRKYLKSACRFDPTYSRCKELK